MIEDIFRFKMLILSVFNLYFYIRKGIRSLLILFVILLMPSIIGLFINKPFSTFDELVVLISLLICMPIFYFDKTARKYKNFYQMCDRIDVVVIIIFCFAIFYEKIIHAFQ